MRPSVQELFEKYRDNLYIIAFHVCKDAEDAKDVVQDTFMQYYVTKKEFDNEQHIRAWLIRVAINKVKNMIQTELTVCPTNGKTEHLRNWLAAA